MAILNWGVIGCGDIAQRRVVPALRGLPNCSLVAIARARAEMTESFANQFGIKKWYATWQELLADKEIDAVRIEEQIYAGVDVSAPQ